MANRYWLGGSWNSTANWSATNNGAGGASIPTSADSVFWHTVPTSSTYTVDVSANCLDMDWTGATNSPTLGGSSTINVYGSLTLISSMNYAHSGQLIFQSTATGKTVTTNGETITSTVTFLGVGGEWTLQDNFNHTGSSFTITNGSLNVNGKTLSTTSFSTTSVNTRTLDLTNSTINCTQWTLNKTLLTLTVTGSTINMTNAISTPFDGGGATYNIVNFSSTATVTIVSSNTFSTLMSAAGKILKLTSGTTQTITNLILNGTTASPSTLQSTTAGTPATIALPAGRYFIRHTSIKDITVTGATAVTSIAGTNVSGNTGITFVTKFEIGRIKNDGSFNWYSTSTGSITKVSG